MATLSGVNGANTMLSWSRYGTGMCLQAVSKALGTYYLRSDRPGWYSYALRGWQNTPASRKHYDRTPPKGAVVYFTAGANGFGHICLSLGGGRVVSTDIPSRGRVGATTISTIERAWGRRFLGWADWLMGHEITVAGSAPSTSKPATPAKPKGLLDIMATEKSYLRDKPLKLKKGAHIVPLENRVNSPTSAIVASKDTRYTATFGVTLSGLPKNGVAQIRAVCTDGNTEKIVRRWAIQEIIGTDGDSIAVLPALGHVNKGERLRLQVEAWDEGVTLTRVHTNVLHE